MRKKLPRSNRCLNCGEPLVGRFCHACGQEGVDYNVSVRNLFAELTGDLLSLDTRFLRTVRTLLFRPGALTQDYNAGHRVRYTPPVRLYLYLSLFFFLALSYHGEEDHAHASPEAAPAVAAAEGEAAWYEQIRPRQPEKAKQPEYAVSAAIWRLGDWIVARIQEIETDPVRKARFFEGLRDNTSHMVIALLPVFALVLHVLFANTGRLYVQHVVFAIHCHAFAMAVLGVSHLLQVAAGGPLATGLRVASIAAVLVYLVASMKRGYGISLPAAAGKSVLLVLAYVVFLYVGLGTVVSLTVLLV